MTATWLISDTHFTHRNIITFRDKNGELVRPFSTVEDMDEYMVEQWNKRVKPGDKVYHMGDVVMNRRALAILKRLNGRKTLIKGNHDIFKLKDYAEHFDDIRAYRIFAEHGLIVSHIPVHDGQLRGRWKYNAHGHLHQNLVLRRALFGWKPDLRYINLCVEHHDFAPVSFDQLLTIMKERDIFARKK